MASAEGRAESVHWDSPAPRIEAGKTSGKHEPLPGRWQSLGLTGTWPGLWLLCALCDAKILSGPQARLPVCSNAADVVRIQGDKQLAAVEVVTQSGSSRCSVIFSEAEGFKEESCRLEWRVRAGSGCGGGHITLLRGLSFSHLPPGKPGVVHMAPSSSLCAF